MARKFQKIITVKKNIVLYFAIFSALTGIALLAFGHELVTEMAQVATMRGTEKANIQYEWKYPAVRIAGDLFGWFKPLNGADIMKAHNAIPWQMALFSISGYCEWLASIILFTIWYGKHKKNNSTRRIPQK